MKVSRKFSKPLAKCIFATIFFVAFVPCSLSQETVFNVPSGDVLDKGKVYAELDFSYRPDDTFKMYTPRVVVGLGKRFEAGVNINGIVDPGPGQTTITPTLKWKVYDGGENGTALLVGDNLFIPFKNKVFNAGTWTYAEFVKTFKTKTRATFGSYYASANVFDVAQRGGGQFAVEQSIGSTFTIAADWFTGKHAAGYVTPGFILKLTPKLTWYAAYQLGNTAVINGNHQFLTELGWKIN
ncbi:MAG TPA: hypothetical protein VFU86_17465 [Terriglobales bacterium]|nr:hypothetical protein [Terriglobales bacterium]